MRSTHVFARALSERFSTRLLNPNPTATLSPTASLSPTVLSPARVSVFYGAALFVSSLHPNLHDIVWRDAVYVKPVIEPLVRQVDEVARGDRHHVEKDLCARRPHRRFDDGDGVLGVVVDDGVHVLLSARLPLTVTLPRAVTVPEDAPEQRRIQRCHQRQSTGHATQCMLSNARLPGLLLDATNCAVFSTRLFACKQRGKKGRVRWMILQVDVLKVTAPVAAGRMVIKVNYLDNHDTSYASPPQYLSGWQTLTYDKTDWEGAVAFVDGFMSVSGGRADHIALFEQNSRNELASWDTSRDSSKAARVAIFRGAIKSLFGKRSVTESS